VEREMEAKRTAVAVSLAGVEEASMGDWVASPQNLAARAFHEVVLGVVPEPTQWHRAPDRPSLCRVGIGRADFLVLAALPALSLNF
jgi:hypothetical protein